MTENSRSNWIKASPPTPPTGGITGKTQETCCFSVVLQTIKGVSWAREGDELGRRLCCSARGLQRRVAHRPVLACCGGSVPWSCGKMDARRHGPAAAICCLHFVPRPVPGFSLQHLLQWLIYLLCKGPGVGVRLYRIVFVEMTFFLRCVFSLFSPDLLTLLFPSVGGGSCLSSSTSTCCFSKIMQSLFEQWKSCNNASVPEICFQVGC